MAELFDKKFVHFMWEDNLEGKEGFFSDSIDTLKSYVEDNYDNLIGKVSDSDRGNFPFRKNCYETFRFFYYDPNYECKRAYAEGKQIQVKNGGSWIDVSDELKLTWDLSNIYRIKPEATEELQEKLNDSNKSWNDFWNDLVEENEKLKKENKDLEWQLNEVATDNDYYKGENKEFEQENKLLKGRVKEFENLILGLLNKYYEVYNRFPDLQKAMEWAKSCHVHWHNLRENPDDLPKGDVHRKILLKDRYGDIYTGNYYPKDECHKENCFAVEWLKYGLQGSSFVAFEQVAEWSEFPKFEE